jgi:enterochelin esterase-like enzyme
LRHPELFGNVLSQSGSYWWTPEGDPEDEWLARQFTAADKLPLHFYLNVGLLEHTPDKPYDFRPTQLVANRHLRNILQAKGYVVQYVEYSGGHDFPSFQSTFADGLLALIGTDQVAKTG